MTTPTLYANTDLVAVSFIKAVLGWTGNVGADLPSPDAWDGQEFVQVTSGVGGTDSIYNPQMHPIVSVKCWARPATTSRRPPWAIANGRAEAIRAGCFAAYRDPVALTLPGGYPAIHVHAAYLLTTPRRLPGDDSSWACFQFNLQLHWKAAA